MKHEFDPQHLDVKAFARAQARLEGGLPLAQLTRLAQDALGAADPVQWRLEGRTQPVQGGTNEVWLHLSAHAALPLRCQRCLTPATEVIDVERDFRFVNDEATATEEDDASQEDVLVLSRDFDALELIEDELIMALPLVPMHEVCPSEHALTANLADDEVPEEKPNPFAALASLRTPKS